MSNTEKLSQDLSLRNALILARDALRGHMNGQAAIFKVIEAALTAPAQNHAAHDAVLLENLEILHDFLLLNDKTMGSHDPGQYGGSPRCVEVRRLLDGGAAVPERSASNGQPWPANWTTTGKTCCAPNPEMFGSVCQDSECWKLGEGPCKRWQAGHRPQPLANVVTVATMQVPSLRTDDALTPLEKLRRMLAREEPLTLSAGTDDYFIDRHYSNGGVRELGDGATFEEAIDVAYEKFASGKDSKEPPPIPRSTPAHSRCPEGWKLVPITPTNDMEADGNASIIEGDGLAEAVYRAMLDAAPAVPVEDRSHAGRLADAKCAACGDDFIDFRSVWTDGAGNFWHGDCKPGEPLKETPGGGAS